MNSPFNFLNSIYNVNQSSRLLEIVKNPTARLEDVLDEDILVQDFRDNKQSVVE
jgi:hypothetical protein